MLGIVILNYKAWMETIKCVDSILSTTAIKIKIYIVDNDSPNDSYEKLYKKYQDEDKVECIKSAENGGFAKGNNIGIRCCIRDHIEKALITNGDVLFMNGCIEHMYREMSRKNNAVLLAPKVMNMKHEFSSPPWSQRQSLMQYLHIRSPQPCIMKEKELTGIHKVYMVTGCCFMIDVGKFVGMGGFDEHTFLYNEEGIISMQAEKAGYEILFDSQAEIVHSHGGGGV